jgi:hypothetical protein
MVISRTYEESLVSRKHYALPNGTGYWKSEYITSDRQSVPAPQAFLVEQDANQVILPHFHEQNQFQVVVRGGGLLGRNPVAAITVHYAGAYTGYGPITAGPEGLWYFTLRPMMDSGAKFLPESRPQLKAGPKKHYHSAQIVPLPESALRGLARVASTIVQDDADGMRVETIRVPPGMTTAGPDPAAGGGQFFLVTSGALRSNDKLHGRLACLWNASGADALRIEAGEGGVEVLLLQCPHALYRPSAAPATLQHDA